MISDNKQKHLELIQGVVNRLAGNLFFLKGWAVTLIGGLFALTAKDVSPSASYLAYFFVIIFWALDGYFLSQERRFRALYKHVATLKEDQIDFSMDTSAFGKLRENGLPASFFSGTLLWFYGSLVLAMLIIKLSS